MNIWHFFSISVVIFTYLPVFLAVFAKTKEEQLKHLTTLFGTIVTVIISEGLKNTIFIPPNKNSIFARPQAAYNCNAFCTDGIQGGAPGFPSTHSASATFLAFSYYNIYWPKKITKYIPLLWALILYSRINLQCHTWLQVGTGTLLGFFIYLIITFCLQK
jgi:membrane-associated phospholipid phosphatase